MTKTSIIGAGNLGAAIANEIAVRGITDQLVLVDIMKELCQGQAADIQQALPFRNRTKVYCGEYTDTKDSDVIIVTAGKPRTPEMQDRLQLAGINIKIAASVIEQLKIHAPHAIIITITNPMDIINRSIYSAGFPRNKVIGFGGQLDSSRLRTVLGHPDNEVDAYILGEHGQDQVPIFSRIRIDGLKKEYSTEKKHGKK